MKLPNLSYMMSVGQLRYIQSMYEPEEYRNPDALVREFLPALQRWGCHLRGFALRSRLRAQPFYYYILARTKYYDRVYADAIDGGNQCIVNIGCGSDTRAYRFSDMMKRRGVRALECDQTDAIHAKQIIAQRKWSAGHVAYLPIDLNDSAWPDFEQWLKKNRGTNTLVMMEGVSPYIDKDAFGRFLGLLATELGPGSRVAYDYKIRGVAADFGRSTRTLEPFRLPAERDEVAAYHEARGWRLEHFETGSDLTLRLVPGLTGSTALLFCEDILIRLLLKGASSGSK